MHTKFPYIPDQFSTLHSHFLTFHSSVLMLRVSTICGCFCSVFAAGRCPSGSGGGSMDDEFEAERTNVSMVPLDVADDVTSPNPRLRARIFDFAVAGSVVVQRQQMFAWRTIGGGG